jgi:hypothetical protein
MLVQQIIEEISNLCFQVYGEHMSHNDKAHCEEHMTIEQLNDLKKILANKAEKERLLQIKD